MITSLSPTSRREAGRRAAIRICALVCALAGPVIVGGLTAGAAWANQYTGMLDAGTLSMANPGTDITGWQGYTSDTIDPVSANSTFANDSWTAPSGTQFAGFAYTAAWFESLTIDPTGALSIGFVGSGGNTPTDLNFPWTNDCSVTEQDSPRVWARNGAQAGATSGYSPACSTSGNNGGWNYNNAELESLAPSVNPQVSYSTLSLRGWCARDNTCNGNDIAAAQVVNLSAEVNDPNNQPTGSGGWTTQVSSSSWYQTDTNAPTFQVGASDPGGVCAVGLEFSGPASAYVQVTDDAPVTENPGAPVGNEFDSIQPCGSGSAAGSGAMPAGIASGTYSVAVVASNPGNWQSGAGLSNAPTIASYANAINVDDTTPTASWVNAPTGWTSNAAETLDVTVGRSGLASVTCSDNGANVAPALVSGSPTGAGTTVWSVPTATNGVNEVACIATNGDANAGLTVTDAATFKVDTTVPVVTFVDAGYTSRTWTNSAQAITVSTSGGPSGVATVKCTVDGISAPLQGPSVDQVTIRATGEHVLDCTAISNTNVMGDNTYNVWIDTNQPTNSFLVNGDAPTSAWLSGTPVVQVIGSESGGVLSGVSQITCSVTTNGKADPGSPVVLSTANGGLVNGTGSFFMTTNGTDVVSCLGVTAAGTSEAEPDTVAVNVDNPLDTSTGNGTTKYGSSELIDDGADPYSDGPNQGTWYRTPQSVTITANNTGGSAPIAGIACKGALTGTWQRNMLNTDAQGGEKITITIPAPGGELACTATDTAGNSYPLGSYLFKIDSTAPTGQFVAQGRWPEPDEVAVNATDDGGSGIAVMHLYAKCDCYDGGAPYDLGEMRYDSASGYYVKQVPDGVAPFTSGSWTFYANDADVAGNTGEITAGPGGDTEVLKLPLLEATQVTANVGAVSATSDAAVPAALAVSAGIDPGASVTAKSLAREKSLVRVANVRVPKASAAAAGRNASVLARAASRRTAARRTTSRRATCAATAKNPHARCSPARKHGHVLTVAYGRSVVLRGALKNTKLRGRPIVGAKVLVYQKVNGAKTYTKIGTATTKAGGRYSYRVRAGASRSIYVAYRGSRILRPASSHLSERFTGRIAMQAGSIWAGSQLVVTGQVKGGHIPPGGVDVTIDYQQVGAPGHGTLGTARTTRAGRYRFTQPFSRATQGLVYRLWAVVDKQPKWPYLATASAKVTRPVR